MKKAAFVLLITAIVLSFLCYGCNKKDNSAITPGVDDSSLGVELPETVDNGELNQLNDVIVNTYRVDNLKYSITTNGTEAAVVYEKYGKNEYLSVNGVNMLMVR